MEWTTLRIGILIGVIALIIVLVIVAVIVGVLIYRHFTKPDRLPKPSGRMGIVSGPYGSENGIADADVGHIDASLYKSDDLWGEYGYRAVKKDDDGDVITAETSDIKWNTRDVPLVIFKDEDITAVPAVTAGFKFRIPKQEDTKLSATKVHFQLIGKFWDNATRTGTPKYDEVVMGEVQSEINPLIIEEYSAATKNPLLA